MPDTSAITSSASRRIRELYEMDGELRREIAQLQLEGRADDVPDLRERRRRIRDHAEELEMAARIARRMPDGLQRIEDLTRVSV
jgi:hypothetical protein